MSRSAWLLLFFSSLAACAAPTGAEVVESDEQRATERAKPPTLPSPGGTGDLVPWGGPDASRWRPEAIVANETSAALNRAWSSPHVSDAVVAVPLKMFSSDFNPYGDGQSNAVPSFLSWSTQGRAPVVATLVSFTNAPRKVLFHLDRSLPTDATSLEIAYFTTVRKSADVTVARTGSGDLEGEWNVPDDVGFGLLSSAAVVVRPRGWSDWFPIWFRMPVRPIRELHASALHFSDGKSIVDREGASVQRDASPASTPYERLVSHSFVASYNEGQRGHVAPYVPDDIHSRFPFGGGFVTTGVGKGWTWVADERVAGTKVMYTCFEGRRPDLEAAAPNGGVASGGGWHRIGDPAETILNDLESAPIVVAAATTNPFAASGLGSGGFAYGLSDVATVRWLFPGEAFVTRRGEVARDASGTPIVHEEFHWYFFHGKKSVCTEEIVSSSVPADFNP